MIAHIGNILVTLLCLGLVVVIHEYGHLLVAKYFKVRVERFTVGFGSEIIGWTAGDGIRYSICAIPLGGMVKMAGEYLEERKNSPDEFFSKPWYQRIAIALAGPTMNYLLAFVLFALTAGIWGVLQPSSEAIVGDIVEGLPAAVSILQPGDKVLAINITPMTNWDGLAQYIHERPDQKLTLTVERRDAKTGARANAADFPDAAERSRIGDRLDQRRARGSIKCARDLRGSLQSAAHDVKAWTMQPLRYIGSRIRHFEGPKELSGPLGIAHMVSQATKEGISYVVYLIAIISTGLGLFNLFPIPVLDGGHVFLYVIEGIRRRPLSTRALQLSNMAGLAVVLTIFLYASYQDVLRMHLGFWK